MSENHDNDPPDDPPILNYANAETGRYVVIARFDTEMEAGLAASVLESEGIVTELRNQLYSRTGNRPTDLAVQSTDRAQAIACLSKSPAARWIVRE